MNRAPVETRDWTWARARLRLGQANVGTFVLISLALVLFGAAPTTGTLGEQVATWATWVLAWAIIQLPFDLLGGWLLPSWFDRFPQGLGAWSAAWLRGVVVHMGWAIGLGATVLATTAALGPIGGFVLLFAVALLLLAFQRSMFELTTGRVPRAPSREARPLFDAAGVDPWLVDVVNTDDRGFVGGWMGLPGRERLLVPSWWLYEDEVLPVVATRRALAVSTGARQRGVFGAAAWVLGGLTIALLLVPGAGLHSASGLVLTSAGVTLWAFLGLLVLPSQSRMAVVALDRAAADRLGPGQVASVLWSLDRDQEAERSRSALQGRIFHPVPTPSARVAQLAGPDITDRVNWRVTRTALYLSWGQFSMLSRAVHCNAGRPELWVVLPGD